MIYYRKNFGFGKLQSNISIGDSSMVMQNGHNFPVDNTQYFKLIIWDQLTYPNPANDPNLEIVTAHYLSSNVYGITRAEEGTTAVSHSAGDSCSLTLTAGLSSDDLFVIGSARVDETNIGNGKTLYYDNTSGIALLKYAHITGTGDMLSAYWDSNGDGRIDSNKIAIDFSESLTGTLPVTNGGTGQTTAQTAIDSLTNAPSGVNKQVWTTNGTNGAWADNYWGKSDDAYMYAGSNYLLMSANTQRGNANVFTYTKYKEAVIFTPGTYRVTFDLSNQGNGSSHAYGRIYKNDVAYGTERVDSSTGGNWSSFSEDLVFAKGDLVQLYSKCDGYYNLVQNFRIYVINNNIWDASNWVVNLD